MANNIRNINKNESKNFKTKRFHKKFFLKNISTIIFKKKKKQVVFRKIFQKIPIKGIKKTFKVNEEFRGIFGSLKKSRKIGKF